MTLQLRDGAKQHRIHAFGFKHGLSAGKLIQSLAVLLRRFHSSVTDLTTHPELELCEVRAPLRDHHECVIAYAHKLVVTLQHELCHQIEPPPTNHWKQI